MIRRSKIKAELQDFAADSVAKTGRNIPVKTVSVISLSFAMCVGAGAGFTGCADPVVVEIPHDLGTNSNRDGGGNMMTSSTFAATPQTDTMLQSKAASSNLDQKRDPMYVTDGTDQYMFFSCAVVNTDKWSICGFKSQGTGTPNWVAIQPPAPPNAALMTSRTNMWDGMDLTAPSVVIGTGSPKYTIYYAANGSNNNAAGNTQKRPSYVTQIGRATSNDGTNWTRADNPVLDMPTFTGTSSTDNPTTARPDAYGATDPFVFKDGANLYMYYSGLDCSSGTCIYQILRSTSSDGGLTFPAGTPVFTRKTDNPEETGGVAGPTVIKLANGNYLLAYTAVRTPATKDPIGVRLALTTGTTSIAMGNNGTDFTRAPINPSGLILRSSATFYSEGATAPSLYLSGTSIKLYFGGLINNTSFGGPYYSIIPADISEMKQ